MVQSVRTELISLRKCLDANQGEGLRVLLGASTSPTLKRLLEAMKASWPQSSWGVFDPVANVCCATRAICNFSHVDLLLSLDADV